MTDLSCLISGNLAGIFHLCFLSALFVSSWLLYSTFYQDYRFLRLLDLTWWLFLLLLTPSSGSVTILNLCELPCFLTFLLTTCANPSSTIFPTILSISFSNNCCFFLASDIYFFIFSICWSVFLDSTKSVNFWLLFLVPSTFSIYSGFMFGKSLKPSIRFNELEYTCFESILEFMYLRWFDNKIMYIYVMWVFYVKLNECRFDKLFWCYHWRRCFCGLIFMNLIFSISFSLLISIIWWFGDFTRVWWQRLSGK